MDSWRELLRRSHSQIYIDGYTELVALPSKLQSAARSIEPVMVVVFPSGMPIVISDQPAGLSQGLLPEVHDDNGLSTLGAEGLKRLHTAKFDFNGGLEHMVGDILSNLIL